MCNTRRTSRCNFIPSRSIIDLKYIVSSIKILSLPDEGTLVYNNTLVTVGLVISIVGNVITGLVYYPEGNPPTVDPQNASFPTSFTYQIIDSDNNSLQATMNIQANIPPSVITVNTPLNKNIDYALSESDSNAAKYFTTIELLDGYTNIPNNSPVDYLQIQSIPLRGELSNGGTLVSVNDIIPYSNLVTGQFAYYPQNIDRGDTTGGDFIETFTYSVLDAQLNESNLVTFNLDCTDVSSNVPFIPSGLTYISPGVVPSLSVTVTNNGPMAYIWLGINNFYTGGGGVQAAVNASYGALTLTNSVQNTTIYTTAYYILNTGESITHTLSANSPGNSPAFLPDDHYVAYLAYSYTIGGLQTMITN